MSNSNENNLNRWLTFLEENDSDGKWRASRDEVRSLKPTGLVRLIIRYRPRETRHQLAGTTRMSCGELCSWFEALHQISVLHRFEHTFEGCAATVPQDKIGVFTGDPHVASVEPDHRVHACGIEQCPWGVRTIGCLNSATRPDHKCVSAPPTTPDIYVVDSGVQPDHPGLNVVESVTFMPGEPPTDLCGHGTHCAGIIASKDNNVGVIGVAPGAPIHSVKVLDKDGGGWMSTVLAGLDWIAHRWQQQQQQQQQQTHPRKSIVVNLSLGTNLGTAVFTSLDDVVAQLIASGVVMVIAAGNDGIDTALCSPAHVPSAIVVGAYGLVNNAFWAQSNFGQLVTLNGPGVEIVSTVPGGYAVMTGTSMAAPHVTGAVALHLALNPGLSPAQVKSALLLKSRPLVTSVPVNTSTPNLSVYADYSW